MGERANPPRRRRVVPAMRSLRGGVCALAMMVACGGSSADGPPVKAPEEPKKLTCWEAVHDESRLLGAVLGEESAPQGLAIQLDEIAASPEITWETLVSLGQLRETAYKMVAADRTDELKKAAEVVKAACARLDVPEERAKAALEDAVRLLAEERYGEMLEKYIPPADLAYMKETGGYEAALERFRGGYGQTLHGQLVKALEATPVLNRDGSVEFRTRGETTEESALIVMEPLGGRWFFRQ